MPLFIGCNLILFKEKNYLFANYDLVKKVYTIEVFFLILLKVQKEGINHIYGMGLLDLQVYLANFEADRVNDYKNS